MLLSYHQPSLFSYRYPILNFYHIPNYLPNIFLFPLLTHLLLSLPHTKRLLNMLVGDRPLMRNYWLWKRTRPRFLNTLPPRKKPIGYKWVFKVKYKLDGTIEFHRAHQVPNGLYLNKWYRLHLALLSR